MDLSIYLYGHIKWRIQGPINLILCLYCDVAYTILSDMKSEDVD